MKGAALTRSETFEQLHDQGARIEPFIMPTATGPIIVQHVGEMLVLQLPDDPMLGEDRCAIILYDGTAVAARIGLLAALSPAEARATAAGLLRIADRVDGGRGKQ